MKYLKILLPILGLLILAGVFLYIYSQKFQEKKSPENEYTRQVVEKNASVNTSPQAKTSDNASPSSSAGSENSSVAVKDSRSEAKQSSPEEEKNNIITEYFLQDLSEYILEQFYPPQSKHNPGKKAESNLNFKSLNARYSLQLTGLRHQGDSLEQARQKILHKVLNPQRLQKLSSRYQEDFLNTLYQEAKSKKYEYLDKGKEMIKKKMKRAHIREMFEINSNYLQDVAAVFNVLASKSVLFDLIKKYLRYEKISKRAYIDNAASYDSSRDRKEAQRIDPADPGLNMQRFANKTGLSLQKYRRILRKKEKYRSEIFARINKDSSDINIAKQEILDICKWFFRRQRQGIKNSAIIQIKDVLAELSRKMMHRARQIDMQ